MVLLQWKELYWRYWNGINMNYNFKPFIKENYKRQINKEPYISYWTNSIYVNVEASKDYKNIERVDVFIDEENSLIKIVKGDNFKLIKQPNAFQINVSLDFTMPNGRYKLIDKNIFKLLKK